VVATGIVQYSIQLCKALVETQMHSNHPERVQAVLSGYSTHNNMKELLLVEVLC
jgi:hypothetical protein